MKVFFYATPDKAFTLMYQTETGKLSIGCGISGGISIVVPESKRKELSLAIWDSAPKAAASSE